MKITVRSKKETEKSKSIRDLKSGTVFKFGNGATALKLVDNKVLLLTLSCGDDWFALSDGSMNYHGVGEILGRLDEVIVVENE